MAAATGPERPAISYLIKDVLDSLFIDHKVKSNKEGSSEDPLEKKCLEACKKYNNARFVSPLAIKVPFEDRAVRMCHVYLHFCKNAYLINCVLSDAYAACTHLNSQTTVFNEVMSCVDWGRINVFSLGGGPGADILGVLMWLHRHGLHAKVNASVADKCSQWEITMNSIFKAMNKKKDSDKDEKLSSQHNYLSRLHNTLDGGIKYFRSDVKSPAYFLQTYSAESTSLAQADIILLPFVMSALKEIQDCSTTIQTILETMKPGAILVYVDINKGGSTETMNELAYWCGLRRIYFMRDMTHDLPSYEKKEYYEKLSKDFGVDAPRNGKVTSIVFKKPSAFEYQRRSRMNEREKRNIQQAQVRLRKRNPAFRLFVPS